MNGNDDDRSWRRFAALTMASFVVGLFAFVVLFDDFLSRFLPVFLLLMSVALAGYALVVGIIRGIQRARRGPTHDERETP